MRALSSGSVLLDLHTSWNSANEIPISTTFAYFSSSFRQTHRGRKGIASTSSSSTPLSSSIHSNSSSIRRPSDRFSNGSLVSSSTPLLSLSTSKELELFLELVPLRMRNELLRHEELGNLIEVVIDLGRKPIARFPSGDWVISDQTVKLEDLHHAISKVGEFSDDNRSGIDHSLHRISAIRNRKMQIIGLTCRFGRAISGNAEMIRDLVEGGGSILVIGRPGVGKTTLIREIARMLADDHLRRVIIVDTSNEIGGDGDIPHSGIGRARRMQVPNVNLQHNVMIEAVENHMPETIIIDEIGTELEALAASTIAQRGVQLVGTAHGMTIDNIIKNPSLQILVGGIESVTLGDEEARKRKVQKTILERKGPPAFTCAVEMISKTDYHVHHRLDATVDAILAGKLPLFEVRRLEEKANDSVTTIVEPEKHNLQESKITENEYNNTQMESIEDSIEYPVRRMLKRSNTKPLSTRTSSVCVYTYKILEADLLQVAEVMGLEDVLDVTDDIGTADAILASSSELKQNRWIRSVAKFHKLPIFVIKSNTMAHMVKAVRMILGMESFSSPSLHLLSPSAADIEIEDDAPERKPSLEEIDALEEVRLAIEYIVIPGGEAVELLPRRSEIIARQMELVESYQLAAEKSGTELNPRLQILPLRLSKNIYSAKNSRSGSRKPIELNLTDDSSVGGAGGTSVARLPLLPE
ncbi:Single-stranded dna-binding protein [Thalictrum thalictroides]|uniref:Single-stranded dna-binding protein n=1 Tax=Thalictrum thalictroides TaxID=46969 RepID=A0A7J6WEA0_THATH|nr:Single-stranded dna-binding protein [Thalictrum thalictroides]